MTDTAVPIDPKRPWITDAADAPGKMNWFTVYLNPLGETSRLHFTRAMTVLFFLTTPFAFMLITGSFLPAIGVVALISILSLIAHTRRLSSARRSPLWSGLVLLPVAVSIGVFVLLATPAIGEANKIADQVAAERAGETVKPEAEAAPETSDEDAKPKTQGERRPGHRPGFSEDGSFSPMKFVMLKAGPPAGLAWAATGFFVFLWTIMWVGRLPNGGGSIRSRFEEAEAEGAETVSL